CGRPRFWLPRTESEVASLAYMPSQFSECAELYSRADWGICDASMPVEMRGYDLRRDPVLQRPVWEGCLPLKGSQHLGCRNHLPHMPLRVVGHVDQRAANRGRELLAAHMANDVEVGRGQHLDALRGVDEREFNIGQQHAQRLVSLLFRLQ